MFYLSAVHLPLEHGERLECDGQVDGGDGLVDGDVVAVEVPVGVHVEDRLVVLQARSELDKLIQRGRNLNKIEQKNVFQASLCQVRDNAMDHSKLFCRSHQNSNFQVPKTNWKLKAQKILENFNHSKNT